MSLFFYLCYVINKISNMSLNRPHRIILELIRIEKKKRKAYLTEFRYIRPNFSKGAIIQLKQVLKGKRSQVKHSEYLAMQKSIIEFENSIK